MKNLTVILLIIAMISCTEKKTETINSSESTNIVTEKQQEIDSLKSVLAEKENAEPKEVEPSVSETEEPDIMEDSGLKDLSGKHNLTLQWLSWENPGTITFTKIGTYKYRISGGQKKGGDYLKIEGEIEHATKDQLLFEGTIETYVKANGGKCLRTGKQIFLQTKNRKYWRMQDMVRCFGLTDYVDIYF